MSKGAFPSASRNRVQSSAVGGREKGSYSLTDPSADHARVFPLVGSNSSTFFATTFGSAGAMKKALAPRKPGPAPCTIHFWPTISPLSNSSVGTSNPILARSAFHPVSCAETPPTQEPISIQPNTKAALP